MISPILALLPLLLGAQAQSNKAREQQGVQRAYLMLGQSNMQGRSCPESLAPALQKALDGIYLFNRTNCFVSPGPPPIWEPLHPGVNANPCLPDRFGPELGLALALRDDTEEDVFIIKYAVDGSRLAAPEVLGTPRPLSWNSDKSLARPGQLLDKALEHCELAKEALPYLRIEGVFWVQGIRDMLNQTESEDYEGNLRTFISDIREELFQRGLSKNRRLPFVLSMIPDFIDRVDSTFQDVVRCAQQSVACSVPYVGIHDPYDAQSIVQSSACNQVFSEPVHYDTPSQIAHGQGLFDAFRNQGCPTFSRDSCVALFEDSNGTINFEYRYPAAYEGLEYHVVVSDQGALALLSMDLSSLNTDFYYFGTSSPGFAGAYGVLDNTGLLQLSTTFALPPPSQTQVMFGRTLHHAVYVVDNQSIVHRSNPVTLYIHQ